MTFPQETILGQIYYAPDTFILIQMKQKVYYCLYYWHWRNIDFAKRFEQSPWGKNGTIGDDCCIWGWVCKVVACASDHFKKCKCVFLRNNKTLTKPAVSYNQPLKDFATCLWHPHRLFDFIMTWPEGHLPVLLEFSYLLLEYSNAALMLLTKQKYLGIKRLFEQQLNWYWQFANF